MADGIKGTEDPRTWLKNPTMIELTSGVRVLFIRWNAGRRSAVCQNSSNMLVTIFEDELTGAVAVPGSPLAVKK